MNAGERRNGVAVRIHGRVPEVFVDARQQPVADRMLEYFGLGVYLVPRHVEHSRQEGLQQPVPTNDRPRVISSMGGKRDRVVGSAPNQRMRAQALQHH